MSDLNLISAEAYLQRAGMARGSWFPAFAVVADSLVLLHVPVGGTAGV